MKHKTVSANYVTGVYPKAIKTAAWDNAHAAKNKRGACRLDINRRVDIGYAGRQDCLGAYVRWLLKSKENVPKRNLRFVWWKNRLAGTIIWIP